jgi:hypothetical protein
MNIVERARNILVQPKEEWPVVGREPSSPADLYRDYVVPLAAIGPAASVIGLSLIGVRLPQGGSFRLPPGSALADAIISYAFTLLAVYLLSLIVDALAPIFAGRKDSLQALKVTAYAGTPGWLAGIFLLIPALALLHLLAMVYGVYLLYLGLPILMKVPQERAIAYTATVVASAILLFILLGLLTAPFFGPPAHR